MSTNLTNPTEVWKPIKNYEGLYEISNLGKVKSLARVVTYDKGSYTKKEKFLTQYIYNCYYAVILCKKSKTKNIKVHRLVAKTFIPNLHNKPHINHKDGNKLNNRAENLEWVTPKENINHAIKNGLIDNKGEKHINSKLSNKDVLEIRKSNLSGVRLAEIYNVYPTTISKIKNRQNWTHVY